MRRRVACVSTCNGQRAGKGSGAASPVKRARERGWKPASGALSARRGLTWMRTRSMMGTQRARSFEGCVEGLTGERRGWTVKRNRHEREGTWKTTATKRNEGDTTRERRGKQTYHVPDAPRRGRVHQSRTSVLRGSAWACFAVAVRASGRGGAGLESASGQRIVRREEGSTKGGRRGEERWGKRWERLTRDAGYGLWTA